MNTLQHDLDILKQDLSKQLPASLAQAFDAALLQIAKLGVTHKTLAAGDLAPLFILDDARGNIVSALRDAEKAR